MDSEPSFGLLIKRIYKCLHAEASSYFSDINLTPAQARILIILHRSDDETARMKELEHSFQCAQSTMAGLISRLEKKGLVSSFVLPDDHRIKCVKLTCQGRALCERSRASIEAAESAMLSHLSAEEKDQAYTLLQKMYSAIASTEH